MKIEFSFHTVLCKNEEAKVTIEVICSKMPQISGDSQCFVVRPIKRYDILANKSTKNWEKHFTVGPGIDCDGNDHGICVEADDENKLFYMKLPTIKKH